MCLIAFANHVHPNYPLLLLANRDEFYMRPTRNAQFWTPELHPEILAGKDLQAGGTWLGITKTGKWAALTNYRDIRNIKPNAPSRGEIVLHLLQTNISPEKYLMQISKNAKEYNGFNLLVGDKTGIFHYSNESDKITVIEDGIYGLSNALLNTPWPKLQSAKNELAKCIHENNLTPSSLFGILNNENLADDSQLPQTGLSVEMERAVSPIFIKTEKYGTRCSSILMIDKSGKVNFIERSFIPGQKTVAAEQSFEFYIPIK